jgi:hypothetical protein
MKEDSFVNTPQGDTEVRGKTTGRTFALMSADQKENFASANQILSSYLR